jgi:hypothetical protein
MRFLGVYLYFSTVAQAIFYPYYPFQPPSKDAAIQLRGLGSIVNTKDIFQKDMGAKMATFKQKLIPSLLIAGVFAFSASAQAQVTKQYDFGILVGTSNWTYVSVAPNNFASYPFAHLQIDAFGNYSEYTLSINNNLFSSFGPGAYLRSIFFDYIPDPSGLSAELISSNVSGITVSIDPGTTYAGVTFDFQNGFGIGTSTHLGDSNWVKWRVNGVGTNGDYRLTNSDVYVNNITQPAGYGPYNAKYALLPVPEPEVYAMLLVGLGLFGFTASRRKQK